MTRIVSLKFNGLEAEVLLRAHAASGVAGLSSHIKRVYFDALKLNVAILQELRSDLEGIDAGIRRVQDSLTDRNDPELVLSLLCGLYVMVRKSVGESIRAQADLAIDIAAIETFLKDT